MKQSSFGYLFEGKVDCKNEFGILDTYKFSYNTNDDFIVRLTFCMDNVCKIVEPSYNDVLNGFVPLKSRLTDEESLDKFLRSHKASYSRLDQTIAIIDAKITFNTKFEQIGADINIYSPNTVSFNIPYKKDKRGNNVPVLIARLNSNYDNYLNQKVNMRLTEMYRQSVKYAITYDIVKTKKDYLKARLGF